MFVFQRKYDRFCEREICYRRVLSPVINFNNAISNSVVVAVSKYQNSLISLSSGLHYE